MNWIHSGVHVTGGASFIIAGLVDGLVERGAGIRVANNLSIGELENLRGHMDGAEMEFLRADLLDEGATRSSIRGMDVVFHLAADHGGCGCVALHQVARAGNFTLDGLVFRPAAQGIRGESGFRFLRLRAPQLYPDGPRRDSLPEFSRRESGIGVGSERPSDSLRRRSGEDDRTSSR